MNAVPVGHVLARTADGLGAVAQSGGGADELDDLTDVTITAPANLELLRYDGSGWANAAVNIEDLANVRADSPVNAGQILQYDGSEWANTVLRFDDGSDLAPSITFTGDTDTGVYRDADNSLGIATGGVETASFSQLMPRIGVAAGVNVTGGGCIAIGNQALDGTQNANTANTIAIGTGALSADMSAGAAVQSVAIGSAALTAQTTGRNNTAVGHSAGSSNIGGSSSVYIGSGANTAISSLSNLVAIGQAATVGSAGGVVIGQASNVAGTDSITIGRAAGSTTMGARCIAIGTGAMDGAHTAANCTDTVAIGHGALTANLTPGSACTTVAVGAGALQGQTTGISNVAVGFDSGFGVATASGCVFVGRAASALADVSDMTVLGSSISAGVASGLFFRPATAIQSGGVAMNFNSVDGRAGPVSSSIRFKTDVTLASEPVDDEDGLSAIDKLRVIEFVGRNASTDDKILGIIAEEAAEHVHPSLIPRDEDGAAFGIDYARLSCLLIQEVQKLRRRVSSIEGKPLPELAAYVPVKASDIYPAEKLMDAELAEQKQQGKNAAFKRRVDKLTGRIAKNPERETEILTGLNKRTRDAVLAALEAQAQAEADAEAQAEAQAEAETQAEAERRRAEVEAEARAKEAKLNAIARRKMAEGKVDEAGPKMKARIAALVEADRIQAEANARAKSEAEAEAQRRAKAEADADKALEEAEEQE
jgi:hypothetical protein